MTDLKLRRNFYKSPDGYPRTSNQASNQETELLQGQSPQNYSAIDEAQKQKYLKRQQSKSKALSPRLVKHMLARKDIHSTGCLLLARGKYYTVVKNHHGLKKLYEINAYTGVVVRRRHIGMRSVSLFEHFI